LQIALGRKQDASAIYDSDEEEWGPSTSVKRERSRRDPYSSSDEASPLGEIREDVIEIGAASDEEEYAASSEEEDWADNLPGGLAMMALRVSDEMGTTKSCLQLGTAIERECGGFMQAKVRLSEHFKWNPTIVECSLTSQELSTREMRRIIMNLVGMPIALWHDDHPRRRRYSCALLDDDGWHKPRHPTFAAGQDFSPGAVRKKAEKERDPRSTPTQASAVELLDPGPVQSIVIESATDMIPKRKRVKARVKPSGKMVEAIRQYRMVDDTIYQLREAIESISPSIYGNNQYSTGWLMTRYINYERP